MLAEMSKNFTPQSAKPSDTTVAQGRDQDDRGEDQPPENKKHKGDDTFSFGKRFEDVMGKPVDDGATKSVDDLLASVFPTHDESEVVDLANPAADDIDVGVEREI
eukprot:SAG11_NODE_9003_length_954_cov_2.877193_1_plen_105_part_00